MIDTAKVTAAIKALGITALNDIQEAALQASTDAYNVQLIAPTGSGKTLAFLLPLLQRLEQEREGVQALIIVPSRELALQVEGVFRGMRSGFKISCCYGGHDVSTEIRSLSPAPAVLVGTPGRLLDHLDRGTVELHRCTSLVLDEFDKSLELGFETEMESILTHMPVVRHKMLTSATEAVAIPGFVGWTAPRKLDFLREDGIAPRLALRQVRAGHGGKEEALLQLLCTLHFPQALIFCNQRESAAQLSAFLNAHGVWSACFHGGMDQRQRESALCKFRNGSTPYLVTTDLAARGLDIPDMECVIHFQMPLQGEAFVHRNGRTARVDRLGTAYLLLAPAEPVPGFIDREPETQSLDPEAPLPPPPYWDTLFIGAGKKEKIGKADIAGFLAKTGGLPPCDIGLIEIKDHFAYAAVPRSGLAALLKHIRGKKIKNKSVRFQVAH